jgi:hypothetical protein
MNGYIIAGLLFLSVVTGGGGVWWGESIGADKCAAAQLKPQVTATKAAEKKADTQLSNGQAALGAVTVAATAQAEVKVIHDTITKTVTKYVEKTPTINDCSLDANGLRIWNDANAGTTPAN